MSNSVSIDEVSRAEEAPVLTKSQRNKLFVSGTVGNFLEIFDFILYSFFADTLGQLFFKSDDHLISLLMSVTTFGLGFLTRPLGSVILGGYCDRHGRKAGLFISMLLMGLGSAFIAFAPVYDTIGIAAPICLVIGRLIQGFSAGGQIAAARSLLMESAPMKQRGFFLSWHNLVQGLGLIAATGCVSIINSAFTEDQINNWAWRLPFLLGLTIIPVAFYVRKHLYETHRPNEQIRNDKHPFMRIVSEQPWHFIKMVLLFGPPSVHTYVMISYMTNYLQLQNIITKKYASFLVMGAAIIAMIFSLVSGIIADRAKDRKAAIVKIYIATFIAGFCTYYFSHNFTIFLICYTCTCICDGLLSSVPSLYIMESFEKSIRTTASGAVYAVGITLFGSMSQAIVTLLLKLSDNNQMAPFWYFGLIVGMGIIVAAFSKTRRYV